MVLRALEGLSAASWALYRSSPRSTITSLHILSLTLCGVGLGGGDFEED